MARYRTDVAWTLGTRLGGLPLGLAFSVLVARFLGPSGQGAFAALTALLALAGVAGGLGLSTALVREAAARPGCVPAAAANARLSGLIIGSVALASLLSMHEAFPGAFSGISRRLLLLGALALPLNFTSSQLHALLLGLGRIRAFNFMELAERLLLLIVAATVLGALHGGLDMLVAAITLTAGVRLALYHILLGRHGFRLKPDAELFQRTAGVSVKAYLSVLFSFMVLKSDLVLLNMLRGTRETGLYSIAVQGADLLLLLPAVAGTLLFPRIAAAGGGAAAAFTARVCRYTVTLLAVGSAAAAAAAPWLVPRLFGDAYQASVTPFWILLPGVAALGVVHLLANDLAGRDYPRFLPALWIGVFALNVCLNLAWIPRWGAAGAAAASSVSYWAGALALTRFWRVRFPSVSLRSLLQPRLEDWARIRFREAGGGSAESSSP